MAATIRAPDAMERARFGVAVAVAGVTGEADAARIIVGADKQVPHGAAYLYHVSGRDVTYALTLRPKDGEVTGSAHFGCAVAIHKDYAVIGARGPDLANSAHSDGGSAFLFDVARGVQLARLKPVDVQGNALIGCHWFGAALAFADEIVLVGAPRARSPCATSARAGAAFVYDLTSRTQQAALLPEDGLREDEFGTAVAATERRGANGSVLILIGAPKALDEQGVVYILEYTAPFDVSWSPRLQAPPALRSNGAHFGNTIAVDGPSSLALIASPYASVGPRDPKSGAASRRCGAGAGCDCEAWLGTHHHSGTRWGSQRR